MKIKFYSIGQTTVEKIQGIQKDCTEEISCVFGFQRVENKDLRNNEPGNPPIENGMGDILQAIIQKKIIYKPQEFGFKDKIFVKNYCLDKYCYSFLTPQVLEQKTLLTVWNKNELGRCVWVKGTGYSWGKFVLVSITSKGYILVNFDQGQNITMINELIKNLLFEYKSRRFLPNRKIDLSKILVMGNGDVNISINLDNSPYNTVFRKEFKKLSHNEQSVYGFDMESTGIDGSVVYGVVDSKSPKSIGRSIKV